MIEQALRRWLLDNTTLAGNRVRPTFRPQSETDPSLTYSRITGPRDNTHDGPSGLASGIFQVDCWAQDYLVTKQLRDEVILIGGYKGTLEGTFISGVFVEGESDNYDQDTGWFQIAIDLKILYKE